MKILLNAFKTIIISLAVFSSSPATEVSGKVIAYACYSCHGEKSANLKLSKNELTATLMAFKTDRKYATIMNRITKGFTDTELKAVASYLSGRH
jgi:sulfide dehydrogenase cytochrome subunit